jgi:hypothetical protein
LPRLPHVDPGWPRSPCLSRQAGFPVVRLDRHQSRLQFADTNKDTVVRPRNSGQFVTKPLSSVSLDAASRTSGIDGGLMTCWAGQTRRVVNSSIPVVDKELGTDCLPFLHYPVCGETTQLVVIVYNTSSTLPASCCFFPPICNTIIASHVLTTWTLDLAELCAPQKHHNSQSLEPKVSQ